MLIDPAQRTLADLDRILADSAEDAVCGDYETIDQVLADEGIAGEQASPEEFLESDPEAEFESAADVDELPDEDLADGMFQTPEQVRAGVEFVAMEATPQEAEPQDCWTPQTRAPSRRS